MPTPTDRRIVVVLSLITGMALLLLGATWKYWHSPQMLWSRQQANEYVAASAALKGAAAGEGGRRLDSAGKDLAAARARFDAIKSKLDRARATNDYACTVLSVAGALTIAIGVWLLWSRNH